MIPMLIMLLILMTTIVLPLLMHKLTNNITKTSYKIGRNKASRQGCEKEREKREKKERKEREKKIEGLTYLHLDTKPQNEVVAGDSVWELIRSKSNFGFSLPIKYRQFTAQCNRFFAKDRVINIIGEV